MPDTQSVNKTGPIPDRQLIDAIALLARQASVEINVPDEKHLADSRKFLAAGTRVYVSHLPGQEWSATVRTCAAVRGTGLEPIAHVPVRLVESADALDRLIAQLRDAAAVEEILLISGDYSQPVGPFQAVSEVLATGLLEKHRLRAVSVAGHPEGHPRVELNRIRAAEREKVRLAIRHGLQTRLVTQFLFEPTPFLEWVNEHRGEGLDTRYICGLAGPAKITTLMRYAMRCGVGPSIRALGTHHGSLKNLIGDHGPDRMLRHLAEAQVGGTYNIGGVHLFCFGGFLRTAEWLARVQAGNIRLHAAGGFGV